MDDKQQNFYKRLLINIRVKCLKQGIKKSEFCLKQGRKISDICLKQGQGMRGRAAPPYRGIYRVPPPPPGPLVSCIVPKSHQTHVFSRDLHFYKSNKQCVVSLLRALTVRPWQADSGAFPGPRPPTQSVARDKSKNVCVGG